MTTIKNITQPSLPEPGRSSHLVDILAAFPSSVAFVERVRLLNLSPNLERKVLRAECHPSGSCVSPQKVEILSIEDEKELATEVLLYRHRFTEKLQKTQKFRQATLTVLQNIYLFSNRKIFFGTATSTESERQEALLLFSTSSCQSRLPLEKTFQHLIIARIWNRIIGRSSPAELQHDEFLELHAVVEKLNTLRNIYMLLTAGLVRMLAAKTSTLYRQSITYEDAVQIGGIGVARAAYRYHQSCGVRFSTFAANWIFKEIQRQALEGRLIRISTHTVEGFAKAAKEGDCLSLSKYSTLIEKATAQESRLAEHAPLPHADFWTMGSSPVESIEAAQLRSLLLDTINRKLSPKSGDIIKRRYGLPPYQGKEHSIVAISRIFGVTRSSIYQQEQSALRKLQKLISRELL